MSWEERTTCSSVRSAATAMPCPPATVAAFSPTRDHLVPRDTVDRFARRFRCSLTAAEGMEHWFHTPEQLAVLRQWEEEST